MRIAIVVSHPIQHFCPMYASWAQNHNVALKVFFASNLGVKSYKDENFEREISWGNLYLEEFDHLFLNGEKTLGIDNNLDAPYLEFALSEFKPDLVIQYGRVYAFNKRLRLWVEKNNVKSAYISDSENRQSQNIFKKIAKLMILPRYFKKFDFFFSVGDANEAYYKTYGVSQDKIHRMNFSIDIRQYDESFKNREHLRKQFRDHLNIGKEELVISVVGKLVSWKNQIALVKLLLNLESELSWPVINLIIAGSGPCEALLKNHAMTIKRNRIHFIGFIDPVVLPQVYSATDIYIHPSKIEPHSLAVSEAIYMGLPVVLSDKSGSYGPTDDVRIGQNGLVFNFGDIYDLFRKIHILKELDIRNTYGKKSKKIADEIQLNAHFEFLLKLLNNFNN